MKKRLFILASGISISLILPFYTFGYDIQDTFHLPGGFKRGLRCLNSGALITYNYLTVIKPFKKNGINEDSHEYAAEKMHKCFKDNKGCYIKFGQIICQVNK